MDRHVSQEYLATSFIGKNQRFGMVAASGQGSLVRRAMLDCWAFQGLRVVIELPTINSTMLPNIRGFADTINNNLKVRGSLFGVL